jgi:hypothetical protein
MTKERAGFYWRAINTSKQEHMTIMALKIVKAEEPLVVENISAILYGPPSSYKTTTALTARNPILFDLDNGASRAMKRAEATVSGATWGDLSNITQDDLAPFDTVVIDTLGALIECASQYALKDPKNGRGGVLNQKGWGYVKTAILRFVNQIKREFKKDIVFVAHTKEKAGEEGNKEYRLDASGGAKDEIVKDTDLMGMIRIDEGGHVIDFNPNSSFQGKNPAQFGRINIPYVMEDENFLAGLIDQTKACLNAGLEQRVRMAKAQREWQAIIAAAEDGPALTEIVNMAADEGEEIKPILRCMVASHARKLGLSWNKETKEYN